MSLAEPKNPCKSVCDSRTASDGVCTGCGRINNEVIAWGRMSVETKLETISLATIRLVKARLKKGL